MKDIEIPKDYTDIAITIEEVEEETRDIMVTSRQLALPSNQRHVLPF